MLELDVCVNTHTYGVNISAEMQLTQGDQEHKNHLSELELSHGEA